MELSYQSTRGKDLNVTASQAILKGLGDDGGLFMPSFIPKLDKTMEEFASMSYQDTAYEVLKLFLTDYTEDELKDCINKAYDSKFDTQEIAPLSKTAEGCYLELFHGSTIAFKDMALSILPHLMITAAKKNHIHNKIVILTATSGDTGTAAMSGFADVEGTEIIVFYPKNGVSKVQELQMVTQTGDNTHVVAIHGNFDDAQTGVKKIFGDREFAKKLNENGMQLSSANSINIGRLVPQIVYYVRAYARLLADKEIQSGEFINISVPTGNFGNILAGYFAKLMGVPIKTLICASNDNKVLYDFFSTGTYDRKREFILTNSPSMDILISSNLERLIYLCAGCDAKKNVSLMQELNVDGSYTITPDMRKNLSDFYGGYATESEVADAISREYHNQGYLMDTHTGVAAAVYEGFKKGGDKTKTVIVSTASPFKFSKSVMQAIGEEISVDEFEIIEKMSQKSGLVVPPIINHIKTAPVRHTAECGIEQMKSTVAEILDV